MSSPLSSTAHNTPASVPAPHACDEDVQLTQDLVGLSHVRSLVTVPDKTSPADSSLGATTLSLIEQSMDAMGALHHRVDLISARARDLIQHTQLERSEHQSELHRARLEANEWRRQALELELRMREAQLRAREAEMGQREAELAAGAACLRACFAEAEVERLEAYLVEIRDVLEWPAP